MKVFQLLRKPPPSSRLQEALLAAPRQRASQCSWSPNALSRPILHRTPTRVILSRPSPARLRQLPCRRPYTSNLPPKPPNGPYNPNINPNSPTPSLTLSQRLRKLSREYGWSAFGVYLLLSTLDFPFCFAAVRWLGAERIGHAEKVVRGYVKAAIPEGIKESWRELKGRLREATEKFQEDRGEVVVGGIAREERKLEAYSVVQELGEYDHGIKEAERENESENA
ncbi:MAG: hypothetical protein Q9217_003222, partial [Psora testacea]